jgi:hypothetical protein
MRSQPERPCRGCSKAFVPEWENDNLRKIARVSAAAKRHFDQLVALFREEAAPPTA